MCTNPCLHYEHNPPGQAIQSQWLLPGVFSIRWDSFTNEEIIHAFRQWVKANRPQNLPPPYGKGYNKERDWRVALERLGMMRLLQEWKRSELPSRCPVAWKVYGKREWSKERKRALQSFRSFFPFLSQAEQPMSWPTKGGRSKQAKIRAASNAQ